MSLSITTRRLADGTAEISPRGEIDVGSAGELSEAIDRVLAGSMPTRIRVDLWQVTLIDSAGISALVRGHRAAAGKDIRLVAAQPTATVHRQLWVCGLLETLGLPPQP